MEYEDELMGEGVVFLSQTYREFNRPYDKPEKGLRTLFHINSKNREKFFQQVKEVYGAVLRKKKRTVSFQYLCRVTQVTESGLGQGNQSSISRDIEE